MNKHVSKHHMQEPTKWNVDLKHNKSKRVGRQPWTKKNCSSLFAITKFFGSSKPGHKNDPTQHAFLEDLML